MRFPRIIVIVTLGLVMGLTGCAAPDLSAFGSLPDVVEARHIADALARGDIRAVTSRLAESQRVPDPERSLELLVGQFPPGAPLDVRVVGYQRNAINMLGGATAVTSNVTFEARYKSSYAVTNVVLRRVDEGPRRIIGLHAQALPQSLSALNAFSLAGKRPVQDLFLLAMIAAAGTTAAALFMWFRRRATTRRKWWWLLGILAGAFKLSVNWTTGAVAIQALTIQLFSVSVMRDGFVGPWILSWSIPAGAIAFMINARRREPRVPG